MVVAIKVDVENAVLRFLVRLGVPVEYKVAAENVYETI